MAKRSMMDQFHELKEANPGTILFFRMGDFYELFHDDAEVGSNVLGLALTSRDKNAENPIPMAGFPWHQLEENLRLMLRAGYKVTVAEQEEELREGAKLLERIVTRIYTPGSLYEESLIGSDASALLCSLMVENEAVAISMIDASTGQAWAVAFEGEGKWASIYDEIMRWNPSELVLTPSDAERSEVLHLLGMLDSIVVSQHSHQPKRASQRLKTMLEVNDLGHLDLGQSPSALQQQHWLQIISHPSTGTMTLRFEMLKFRKPPRGWFWIKPRFEILRSPRRLQVNTKDPCCGL